MLASGLQLEAAAEPVSELESELRSQGPVERAAQVEMQALSVQATPPEPMRFRASTARDRLYFPAQALSQTRQREALVRAEMLRAGLEEQAVQEAEAETRPEA